MHPGEQIDPAGIRSVVQWLTVESGVFFLVITLYGIVSLRRWNKIEKERKPDEVQQQESRPVVRMTADTAGVDSQISVGVQADKAQEKDLLGLIRTYRCRLYTLLASVSVQLLISVIQVLITKKSLCQYSGLYISTGFLFWIKIALIDYLMLYFAST